MKRLSLSELRLSQTTAAVLAVGIASAVTGWAIGQAGTRPRPNSRPVQICSGPVTVKQAGAAKAWLSAHMPNTRFTAATPDPDAPWLVKVHTRDNPAPLYFDPAHHALLIGLVVNFNDPGQRIAQGIQVGGTR